MKFAPLVLHTGQHYDDTCPTPSSATWACPDRTCTSASASDSRARQSAAVIKRFEPVVLKEKPDWVLVVGDVNSTFRGRIAQIDQLRLRFFSSFLSPFPGKDKLLLFPSTEN